MADQTPPATPAPDPSAEKPAEKPAESAAPPPAPKAAAAPTEPAAAAPVAETGDAEKAALAGDPAAPAPTAEPSKEGMDDVLAQASFEDVSTVVPEGAAPDAEVFKLPSFQQVITDAQVSSIDLLRDVELNVKIELGRSRMMVEDVLKLSEGSVVELDKLAGDPVDVFVNERLVARGEVLVLNDNFCVRVNEIVAGAKEEGL
ncbi:MAG: flagellar motor switch protein FliN [Tepidisphaeraceae bacterium]|jgi:flagellar motor switch protein FliN/FliY